VTEYALFAGVARSLIEVERSQGNLPTINHLENLRGVVETEKLWGQSPLASRAAPTRPAEWLVFPFRKAFLVSSGKRPQNHHE
jgi:hypothetical protein